MFNQGTRNQPLGDPKAGLSAELDAMAAYVASLDTFAPSPHRAADGSLTADGVAGRGIFQARGCAQCHGGVNFSESGAATLRDVGTIRQPGSGKRLGGALTGLDPPTLRGVWETAPYLHDGSAATLEAAVRAHGAVTISDPDLVKLVAYLKQIDGQEPAPTPAAPDTQAPTKPATVTISKVNGNPKLAWGASTDNVGVVRYAIHRSTNGTFGPEFATTSATTWTDASVTEAVQIYVRHRGGRRRRQSERTFDPEIHCGWCGAKATKRAQGREGKWPAQVELGSSHRQRCRGRLHRLSLQQRHVGAGSRAHQSNKLA